jgi:hypothetical protein
MFDQQRFTRVQQSLAKLGVLSELRSDSSFHHFIFDPMPVQTDRVLSVTAHTPGVVRPNHAPNLLLPRQIVGKLSRLVVMFAGRPLHTIDRNRIGSEIGKPSMLASLQVELDSPWVAHTIRLSDTT